MGGMTLIAFVAAMSIGVGYSLGGSDYKEGWRDGFMAAQSACSTSGQSIAVASSQSAGKTVSHV